MSNHQKFTFKKADTHSSVETFEGGEKGVYFNANGSNTEFAISVFNFGDKLAYSYAEQQGYNVSLDNKGRNQLTGHIEDGGWVFLKILEVFEVECLNPPKQPEKPE